MALGPEEESRLAELAERTRAEDPHFALGLGAGEPRPPAEYRRRRRSGLRIALGLTGFAVAVALFAAGAPGGGFVAALGAVLALATIGDGFSGPGD
ncbi:DUF3040 domain-containing protein [Catellatospora sichuanensis]|uniref:DUF3040 domain-containing protein n=1 Tax=Catellatospora sichuanensis TaxID=1969805 RepID=UPI0011824926|nr:DUF3040 domain-containing protein [Catellatospora sichuanensis]